MLWAWACLAAAASLTAPRGTADEGDSDAVEARSTEVTYNRDVAKILFKHCSECHRPGEVAPFSLLEYDDAAKRARQIAEVVETKLMPPWKAERGFGSFLNERHLSKEEIQTLVDWADGGAPEGDKRSKPKPPKFVEGWQLGKPDMVLDLPSYAIPAEGKDIYRCFVIPLKFQGQWVEGIEFRPGNRRIVHHALMFLDPTGKARENDASDPEPGYATAGGLGFIPMFSLGGWAPGTMPYRLAKGVCKPLPGGVDLVVQMHYHPSGKPEVDQSRLGVYFSKRPPKRRDIDLILGSLNIDIEPGDKEYRIQDSMRIPVDVEVHGIVPHAHYLAKEIKVTARPPRGGGKDVPLLWIKDWDFDWQEHYRYARPVPLKAGTRVDLEFIYDNSEDNPNNPSKPPQRVVFGEQTTDEMCLLWLNCVPKAQEDYPRLVEALNNSLLAKAAGLAGGNLDGLARQLLGK
jgi:mono/diheme cytochrome c family protein